MQNFKALVIYDEAIMRYFIAFCLKRLPYIEEVLECCYDDLDDVLKHQARCCHHGIATLGEKRRRSEKKGAWNIS